MRIGSRITIKTDTVVDEEGVPVSISFGAKGILIAEHPEVNMSEFLIWWAGQGPEILATRSHYIESRELVPWRRGC